MYGKIAAAVVCLMLLSTPGESSVFISEFMADVSTTQGDANQDGVISSSQDEFVELYNPTLATINVSGWTIYDAVGLRHTFSADTVIDPLVRFTIFGGGLPNIDTPFQTASSGSLGLNNSGDTITLFDDIGNLIDQVVYGSEANVDQSLARFDKGDPFIKHSLLSEGELYSPGYPKSSVPTHTVPEPMTMASFVGGLAALMRRRMNVV